VLLEALVVEGERLLRIFRCLELGALLRARVGRRAVRVDIGRAGLVAFESFA